MKSSIILSILVLASTSFAAEPTAAEVAAAILGDSHLEDARKISEIQYFILTNGTDRHTEHTLKFSHNQQNYSCETFNLNSTPTGEDEYFVAAEIADCKNSAGKKLVLKNDYTNERGQSVFRRIFFNDNKKFRKPNEREENIVKGRDPRYFRNAAHKGNSGQSLGDIKVIHTNDLEDGIVVIDSTGEIFGAN